MRRNVLWIISISVGLLFVGSTETFAQKSSNVSINGESTKKVGSLRTARPNGKTSIVNNKKQKRIKTKIRILHSDCCPTYRAYFSKPHNKKEKMLRRRS